MRKVLATRLATITLAATLLAAPAWAGAPWTIDWWTLDGGGEVFTFGGDWALSGTIGQWDATAHTHATGGAWALTGGFWAVSVATESDNLFKDSFE